jgi:hypothetical protein
MHRLAAFASRWEELVAPSWTSDKMGTHQYIIDFLRHEKAYQSQMFKADDVETQTFIERIREKSVPAKLTRL